MHKTLSALFFLCLPLQAFSSQLEMAALGETVPFQSPFTVDVTVIERVDGLVFWAEPVSTDLKGVSAVKNYIELSKTSNYMPAPFVFQFRLAGVKKEDDSGADLTNDGFSRQTSKTITAAFEGKSFRLTCYGRYSNTIVPYCDLTDTQGQSPLTTLIRNGLLIPEPLLGLPDEAQKKTFDLALEAAKTEQVGIWKPFHGMFRGLQ